MTTSKYSVNDAFEDLAMERLRFSEQQADAYSSLLPVYEARHDLLQPIRHVVLGRVLDKLEAGSSVLEVGCGCGASLALIREKGFKVEGIDLSLDMVTAARARSRCLVTCGDFRNRSFEKRYDLVFAQAFVHLFPKAEAPDIIHRLQTIALKRVYFSTTLADHPSEGWEEKDGVLRYRSRYTSSELRNLIADATSLESWKVRCFELVDPLAKHWINILLDRA